MSCASNNHKNYQTLLTPQQIVSEARWFLGTHEETQVKGTFLKEILHIISILVVQQWFDILWDRWVLMTIYFYKKCIGVVWMGVQGLGVFLCFHNCLGGGVKVVTVAPHRRLGPLVVSDPTAWTPSLWSLTTNILSISTLSDTDDLHWACEPAG